MTRWDCLHIRGSRYLRMRTRMTRCGFGRGALQHPLQHNDVISIQGLGQYARNGGSKLNARLQFLGIHSILNNRSIYTLTPVLGRSTSFVHQLLVVDCCLLLCPVPVSLFCFSFLSETLELLINRSCETTLLSMLKPTGFRG